MVEEHLHLVITLARKFVNARRSFLDLIMEGNRSLMRVIDTLDRAAGEAFVPHARYVIGATIAKVVR